MLFMVLVVLAAGLLMFELTALFSTPIPDSYLWWGDESWLMLEFKAQIASGHFHHPFALGSTLQQGSGPIFSNMWITALLYGGAATLFKSTNVIIVGRTVTVLLATGLVFALYEIVRKLTNERLLAIFAVILLISSRSFFFTSHSARYDILSAGAIVLGFFLLLTHKLNTTKIATLAGALSALGLIVSIHVTTTLVLTCAIAVLIDSDRRVIRIVAYLAGVVASALIIVLLSFLLHNGGSSASSGFALNIHDIPALRIYSRSVQFANIAQRVSTFRFLAWGYFILIVVILLAFTFKAVRSRSINLPRGAWLAFALLFSWLEFESAAPTSYLIYVLPILSVATALAIRSLIPRNVYAPMLAVGAIVLILFAIRDDWHARANGKKLTLANDEAVSAALAAIEQDTTHPIVLTFNPAVQRSVMDTSIQLMTTHFIEYPASNESVDSVMKEQHVKYVVLYRNTLKPDYMREVQPIADASKRLGVLVWERAGFLTDIGRSYFETDFTGPDTLQVYRIRD
jgi:hypothetical protein